LWGQSEELGGLRGGLREDVGCGQPIVPGEKIEEVWGDSLFKRVSVTVKVRRLINPRIYHSEVVKVRKMLVNASISGFYQTISVNADIYRHLLVKIRFVWL